MSTGEQAVTGRGRGTLGAIVELANPVFIALAVGVPFGAYLVAALSGNYYILKYVHILTGAFWTGIDLFMGFVLGPVLGALSPKDRTAVFKQLMPKMTFLMPTLAIVATTAGIQDAQRLGMFSPDFPWALAITALLTLQGVGVLLPNEIQIFRQLLSPTPDVDQISRLGMRNAKLGGLQGLFQLVIIFIMVNLRY